MGNALLPQDHLKKGSWHHPLQKLQIYQLNQHSRKRIEIQIPEPLA